MENSSGRAGGKASGLGAKRPRGAGGQAVAAVMVGRLRT
jgi:hypothetical protein